MKINASDIACTFWGCPFCGQHIDEYGAECCGEVNRAEPHIETNEGDVFALSEIDQFLPGSASREHFKLTNPTVVLGAGSGILI